MCGKSSNSSNLQMAGGCHIYRPPSHGAVAPTVSRNLRIIGWTDASAWGSVGSSGHSQTRSSRWASDALFADVITPVLCSDASPIQPVLKDLFLCAWHRLWNIVCPMHWCLSWILRFNRCLIDLHQKPGHRIIRQPSDAPMPIASVLPVLLKYLYLDFFDLDFFMVSSILVLWTLLCLSSLSLCHHLNLKAWEWSS